jgi:hypothetical protein
MSDLSPQGLAELHAAGMPNRPPAPLSLSPYRPIGLGVCRICWNTLNNEVAYCTRCGHSSTCFLGGDVRGMCFQHPERRAERTCNYCVRSFCMGCLESNADTSLCLGCSTYCCHLCSGEMHRLKQAVQNRDRSLCFRHPNLRVSDHCNHCAEGLCDFCTYYPVTGPFRKRIVPTPLCIGCIQGRAGRRILRCIVKCNVEEPDWNRFILRG